MYERETAEYGGRNPYVCDIKLRLCTFGLNVNLVIEMRDK